MSSKKKKEKVFVAMSGGVDSSVAAALLKKEGYDVTGVHMVCWDGCENSADRRDAMKVSAVLDIPFLTWDFRDEYKKEVYEYMIFEYVAGRTPNPDVMCNKQIKFGIFLKKALESGADFIATGHYVKKSEIRNPKSETISKLQIAKDLNKDQSYFLWTLTQNQLKHCLFPIGNYLKSEVRNLAKKFKLPTSQKKDSQGLCFVGKVDFLDFLKEKIPVRKGDVLNSSGKKIGTHDGAYFYTKGQRHGLGLGGLKNPVFVAEKNIVKNTITVVEEQNQALYKKEIEIQKTNWINTPKSDQVFARIRYRQPLQKARIMNYESRIKEKESKTLIHNSRFLIRFELPQRAIASGQSIVFYSKNGEMLGGGVLS